LYAASGAQVLPLLGAARHRFRLTPARRWVVVWCIALLAGDAGQLLTGRGTPNSWVGYTFVPLQNAIMLWTLSLWQQDPVSRLAFRVAIPLYLAALLALIPAVKVAATFNQITWPFQAFLLLAGSLFTLVRRSVAEPDRVTSRDWFWITFGASLFFAFRMALPPFVDLMLPTHRDLARFAYVVSSWADIVAYVLIARGMVCPLPPQARSGGFS
jgi:hypothetical protein